MIATWFWWWTVSATVLLGGGPRRAQALARRRQTATDGVPLPAIPTTVSGDSVHMLSAVRFPPPALLFADPDRKWTTAVFERPDRPTTYAVTDGDGADAEETFTARPPAQREPEATTAAGPEAEATTVVGRVDDEDGPRETATAATATDGRRRDVPRRRPVTVQGQQRWPDRAGWYDGATPASVVRGHRRRQTILLTSRPLPPPPPLSSVRFPNVDYVISRRGETPTVNLSYVR